MADNPAERTPDKEKFAPKNVTADPNAHIDHRDQTGKRDLARGSETATRDASQHRG